MKRVNTFSALTTLSICLGVICLASVGNSILSGFLGIGFFALALILQDCKEQSEALIDNDLYEHMY